MLRYGGRLLPEEDAPWVEPEREDLTTEFVQAAANAIGGQLHRGDLTSALALARHAVQREPRREETHLLVMRCLIAAGNPSETRQQFASLTRMLAETGDAMPSTEAHCLIESLNFASPVRLQGPERVSAEERGPVLPSGMVALLATDIVGSTGIGRRMDETAFSELLILHHALLRAEFARAGGTEFKEGGDGFWVAFPTAKAALSCACACQQALEVAGNNLDWKHPVEVRMAIHVADLQSEPTGPNGALTYHGLVLHDLARLTPAARGQQILLSEAAEAVLRDRLPGGVRIIDRGIFILRDAPRSSHLYEATWRPGLETAVPNAPRAHTLNLPPTLTRFVGRQQEIESIVDVLRSGMTRLLTLTGIGGTGKTRLAIEAARELENHFEGGVWFVPLVGVADGARIVEAVRDTIVPHAPADPWDALRAGLADRPCLVVLDNIEQLIECGSGECHAADFANAALSRFPHLTLLVTSRRLLDVAAEQEFVVCPLALPAVDIDAAQLRTIDSVVLFEDRARRAHFDFHVTVCNAPAVATLCRRLEGIPLALELAASWARVLSPAEMLEQFDDIRRGRSRDMPERHRSLDAAIEGSYRLLSPKLQRVFLNLSVFASGWTLSAAKVVCDESGALPLLSDLRDSSLVLVEQDGGDSRYSFLETVREYAASRLASAPAELADAQVRHERYFAGLAAEANDALQGPEQGAWLTRLAADHTNLLRVLNRAERPTRLRMAGHLHRYFMVRGYLPEARALLSDVLSGDNQSVSDADLNKAINVAGVLALTAGDLDGAKLLFAASEARCSAIGDERGAGAALINLGIVANEQGSFAESRAAYEATLELWRRLDRRKTLAIVLGNLGAVAIEQHDFTAAQDFLQESLELQNSSEDLLVRANTLQNLVFISRQRNDLSVAFMLAAESLTLRVTLADYRGIAGLMTQIAAVQSTAGNLEHAALLYGATEAAVELCGTDLMPTLRQGMENDLSDIRAGVGDEKMQRAWDTGRAMGWEQIIDAAKCAVAS